jgi:ATP-dependent helicase/nuclease subunit B
MENGYVVLHGLTNDEFTAENHAQFYLNQLLKFLDVEKKAVKKIAEEKFLLSDEVRQDVLSLMMLPSEETAKWQKISSLLDAKKAAQDLLENFQIIEAPNEIKEAKLIALALFSATQNKQNSALITNNNKLAKLVKLELKRFNLPFNDARNLGILRSQLINFLILILELNESEFDSTSLLALLKHPLFYNSKNQEILNDFEIKVLRKERLSPGLHGIHSRLEKLQEKELSEFFTDFYNRLQTPQERSASLIEQIEALIKTAENLSDKAWQELIEAEAARAEIAELFEKLKAQNNISFSGNSMLAAFKALLDQISYFEKNQNFAAVQILSTLEARLLNYDLVIVASLNEGDFPEISAENWLGKKIKKDLGIDHSLKKIGQSAYDFCNYLSNKKVILTRCKSRNGVALIESPFLLKLKTICKKLVVNIENGQKYFDDLQKLNTPPLREIKAPAPKPKSELRPKTISITEIPELISSPYSIYAKKILRLKGLEKIDFESSYAEFGAFVHKALEEFIKNPKAKNFLKKSEKLFEKYFTSKDAKLIWWPKFENIFADFLAQNSRFSDFKNHVETPVKLPLSGITINGKIDRVIFNADGFAEIFDYKTGQISSAKNVLSGIDPQLTIAALTLVEGIIESQFLNVNADKIQSLNYWKLSSSSVGEIKKICAKNEEIKILLASAKAGLSRLFEYFSDENNAYIATKNSEKNEYWHLQRGV